MFEVDWQDYDCERVGERRARKAIEREKKRREDASSGHMSTASTRPSSYLSDRNFRDFFGSIGRRKSGVSSSPFRSKKHDLPSPEVEATERELKLKRDSMRLSTISSKSITSTTPSPFTEIGARSPEFESVLTPKRASTIMRSNSPESPDRFSKDSMLSKMTQLTIPTLEAQGSGLMPQTAATAVQELDRRASLADKPKTTYQHGSIVTSRFASDPRTPKTSRTPRTAEASLFRVSRDEMSASDLIDDWFTALHNPAQNPVAPEFDGAVRRRSAGMTPNVSQAPKQSSSATRRARNSVCVLPKATPIRFSAENPDDWVPLEEWDSAASTKTQSLAPVDEALGEHDERLDVVAADLENVHISQADTQVNVDGEDYHESQTDFLERELKGP